MQTYQVDFCDSLLCGGHPNCPPYGYQKGGGFWVMFEEGIIEVTRYDPPNIRNFAEAIFTRTPDPEHSRLYGEVPRPRYWMIVPRGLDGREPVYTDSEAEVSQVLNQWAAGLTEINRMTIAE